MKYTLVIHTSIIYFYQINMIVKKYAYRVDEKTLKDQM